MDQVAQVVARDSRIAYALVFGSTARGAATPDSDVDVAIGLQPGAVYSTRDVGALIADLEHATERRVDLVVVDEASPALAYRIFRDGVPVFVGDHQDFVARKTKAILAYLDFRPVEQAATRGVLTATARG